MGAYVCFCVIVCWSVVSWWVRQLNHAGGEEIDLESERGVDWFGIGWYICACLHILTHFSRNVV